MYDAFIVRVGTEVAAAITIEAGLMVGGEEERLRRMRGRGGVGCRQEGIDGERRLMIDR